MILTVGKNDRKNEIQKIRTSLLSELLVAGAACVQTYPYTQLKN